MRYYILATASFTLKVVQGDLSALTVLYV